MMLLPRFLILLLSCFTVLAFNLQKSTTPQRPISNYLFVQPRQIQQQPQQQQHHAFSSLLLNMEASTSSSSDAVAYAEPPSNIIKKVITPGYGPTLRRGDVATVSYSLYLPDSGDITVSRAQQQKLIVADGTMIPGWDLALAGMAVGERAIVRIPPSLAYGATGVPPLIPPQATLELDVTITNAAPPSSIVVGLDFDGLAYADNTPRTADQIAAAYEARQAKKALEPQKEGFDAWLDKVRNFYFFGFFEGETGQQAPWLLRPSITFPIIFVIVGLAFYVSYSTGSISERGIPAADELDEIVLTTAVTSTLMMKQIISMM